MVKNNEYDTWSETAEIGKVNMRYMGYENDEIDKTIGKVIIGDEANNSMKKFIAFEAKTVLTEVVGGAAAFKYGFYTIKTLLSRGGGSALGKFAENVMLNNKQKWGDYTKSVLEESFFNFIKFKLNVKTWKDWQVAWKGIFKRKSYNIIVPKLWKAYKNTGI